MEWFIERFNTAFAGYAPFDIFGCGLVISVSVWLAILLFRIITKACENLLDFILNRLSSRRKTDTAEEE